MPRFSWWRGGSIQCAETFLGDLIKSMMDLSNTTEKQKQSMIYWGNYIIHLCTADNEIRQSQRKREREQTWRWENINSFTNKTMKWMWQKPSDASVPPVMGEFWQDNHHPVFRENAHLASEPSLTSCKAISLTLSHSSSWKSWKDKCLLCSFSVEETRKKEMRHIVLSHQASLRGSWGLSSHQSQIPGTV